MPATSAFLASLGVNTHVDATDTAYGNVALVRASLAYLGVSLIRDHAYDIDRQAYQALARSGVRVDLIVDGDPAASVAALLLLGTGIAAFEGANEVDIIPVVFDGITNDVAAAIAEQQALYAVIRAIPSLDGVPVVNQSIGYPENAAAYAATLTAADIANAHIYTSPGDAPLDDISGVLQTLGTPAGIPITVTETGYYTLPVNALDDSGVDESVQAKLTLDTLLDDFKLGIAQTFLYELFDEAPDPAGADPELHYGLFHADGSPKPVAIALHNLTTILSASGGAPPSLAPSISNLPDSGNTVVLTSAAGPTDIIVWAEPVIWDPIAKREIPAPATTVTVSLGQIVASVSVYDPLLGTTAIATYTNAAQVSVALTDHPLIIRAASGVVPAVEQTIGVYRFFDSSLGTHFYTADAQEAATVLLTRPDLIAEGVGLKAISPQSDDPNAAPVYRFFDTQHGTHFFTASTDERDTVIATRSDLVYEPSSVFYEHTAGQTGDIPVYRFFDTRYGTHFYTDSASERAMILSTRADLVAEGVGFYEPRPTV